MIQRAFTFTITLAVSGLLVACATRRPFSPTECNQEAAYDRGYREGLYGMTPETEYSHQCREDLRETVRKGYREGHERGFEEFKVRVAEQTPPSAHRLPPPDVVCKISLKAVQFEARDPDQNIARSQVVKQCSGTFPFQVCNALPRCGDGGPTQNPKAHYCEISPFRAHFSAFGPTELEAKLRVQSQCLQKHQKMFCEENDIRCRPNR